MLLLSQLQDDNDDEALKYENIIPDDNVVTITNEKLKILLGE